jgi:hypothetical protein
LEIAFDKSFSRDLEAAESGVDYFENVRAGRLSPARFSGFKGPQKKTGLTW